MFCNHGCNGTFNLGDPRTSNLTEANVDPKQPLKSTIRHSSQAFNPLMERHIREYLTHGDYTIRDIKRGEEILCNYVDFIGSSQYWEEDILELQGMCTGSVVGEITAYELERVTKMQ